VVYNSYGESFNDYHPEMDQIVKEKYQLPAKYLFCLGNTSPKKNLSNILKAYYRYLDRNEEKLPLVLADHSPGDLFLFLNSANTKYKPYIRFIGYVSNDEIPSIYKNSELFLYPSIRESFGIPILEGMKMGTPVITSNISCMPEIAGKSAYFVDPFDVKSITKGIEVLLHNTKVKTAIVERGLQRVKNFSWEKSARQTLEIYEKVYEESQKRKKHFSLNLGRKKIEELFH